MTPQQKFKKDMKFLQENYRRTYHATWYEKTIDILFSFPFILLILTLIYIINLILKIYENR
jgi:ABC-type methionine transport system permease subunit